MKQRQGNSRRKYKEEQQRGIVKSSESESENENRSMINERYVFSEAFISEIHGDLHVLLVSV